MSAKIQILRQGLDILKINIKSGKSHKITFMEDSTKGLIEELEMEKIQILNSFKHVMPNSDMLYKGCKRIIEIFDTIYCLEQD